jgi:hypothetical protein
VSTYRCTGCTDTHAAGADREEGETHAYTHLGLQHLEHLAVPGHEPDAADAPPRALGAVLVQLEEVVCVGGVG